MGGLYEGFGEGGFKDGIGVFEGALNWSPTMPRKYRTSDKNFQACGLSFFDEKTLSQVFLMEKLHPKCS